MLADDDGIVDDDAERHDQREEREHVERLPGDPHEPERRHHRDRNAGRNPQRDAAVEEGEEHDHDHEQAGNAVLHQDHDPVGQSLGPHLVLDQLQRGRQLRSDLREILVEDRIDLELVGAGGALHRQLDRPQAVGIADGLVRVVGARHIADVSQLDLLAGRERLDDDAADRLRRGGVGHRPHLPLDAALQVAGGKVAGVGGDTLGNVGKRQVEAAQLALGHLDHIFGVAEAVERDLVDAPVDQAIANLTGERLQRVLAEGTAQSDARHPVEPVGERDTRPLRVFGKRGDAGDGLLHVRQRLLHVGAFEEF